MFMVNYNVDQHGNSPVKRQRNVSLWFQISSDETETPSWLTDPLLRHIPVWNSPKRVCNFWVLLKPICHKRRNYYILMESCISCHIKGNRAVVNRYILNFIYQAQIRSNALFRIKGNTLSLNLIKSLSFGVYFSFQNHPEYCYVFAITFCVKSYHILHYYYILCQLLQYVA